MLRTPHCFVYIYFKNVFISFLSPSIHKFDDVFIYSIRLELWPRAGLSAAFGHEPFGSELKAELLKPNGVSPSV